MLGVLAVTAAVATAAGAEELELTIRGGRVTLVATDARVGDVLAAWSRVGGTRFVDAEALGGEVVTLHMVDVAEAEALDVLLRPAAGYIAASRSPGAAGGSRYDRVKVLAERPSSPPAARPAATGGRGAAAPAAEPAVQLDHLQGLLEQAGGRGAQPASSGPGSERPSAATRRAPLTQFPGIAGVPPRPPRWQRRAQQRPDAAPFEDTSDPPTR